MPTNKTTKKPQLKKGADLYDAGNHNYAEYWKGRDYEHAAEELAINKLLKGRHYKKAVDVGGGYGRLSKFLTKYADNVVLAEPSKKQHAIAADYLKDSPQVVQKVLSADNLGMPDKSVDLVLVVRVLHHLPDPTLEFKEIARVLKPGGTFLLEFANNNHFLNRVRYASKGKRVPLVPVDIRSPENQRDDEVAFVNHHPRAIVHQLADAGFVLEAVLSGSNLRSPRLKKILPKGAMLRLEKFLQPVLAPMYFGPSIWLRLRKK